MKQFRMVVHACVPALMLAACGGSEREPDEASQERTAAAGELTAFQHEHGIGPVTELVELAEPDHEKAEDGEEIFRLKCMACHRLEERYIGPPLGDVLERRSPAYVMNQMLNPTVMAEKHPVAKALLAEYLAPMPNQDLTLEDARAVLEYLRLAESDDDLTE